MRYQLRRLTQTPGAFGNWSQVLRDMAAGWVRRGPAELTFRTRDGVSITTPNRPGARVPVYEVFADDSYNLNWFLGPLAISPIQVIDIGGHVGTFACRVATLNPQARVHSYEPSPTTVEYLRRNVAQNGLAERVEITQAALSSETGTVLLSDNGSGSGLNQVIAASGRADGAVEVPAIAFDDAVAAAPEPVDFVKIDCEGAEYALVLASSPQSWASVRRVVIEHHPVEGHSWPELRDFFAGVGLVEEDLEEVGFHGCAWLSRDPLPPRLS